MNIKIPTLKDYEGEFRVSTINLAVARPFKNMEGKLHGLDGSDIIFLQVGREEGDGI